MGARVCVGCSWIWRLVAGYGGWWLVMSNGITPEALAMSLQEPAGPGHASVAAAAAAAAVWKGMSSSSMKQLQLSGSNTSICDGSNCRQDESDRLQRCAVGVESGNSTTASTGTATAARAMAVHSPTCTGQLLLPACTWYCKLVATGQQQHQQAAVAAEPAAAAPWHRCV